MKKLSKCCNAEMFPSGQCIVCGANGEEDEFEAEKSHKTKMQSLEDAISGVMVED